MGTLGVFASSYCSTSAHSCVLLDSWLALTLLVLSVVAVIALLVCCRFVLLTRASDNIGEDGEDVDRSTIRRVLSGLHRRNRSRVSPPSSKVQSLPLAVIKKDATAANIHSHKNSRQHGADFLMQTRRMSITDMASGTSSHQLQRRAPRAEPAVLSVVKPLAEIVPPGGTSESGGRKRPRPSPLIVTDNNAGEGDTGTRKNSSSFKLSLPSLRRTSQERSDQQRKVSGTTSATAANTSSGNDEFIDEAALSSDASFVTSSAPSSPSMTSKITAALRTPFTPKRKLTQQRQLLKRQQSAALFAQPSYSVKHELAELSPDDRVQNERRSSIQRRAARRLSVGASSLLHFQVGPDHAAVSVYEVKLQEITLVKRLALGPLSEVYAAIWRDTKVGVKLLMPREGVVDHLEEAVRNFRREIWVMSCLKHPNVLTLIGASLTPFCYVLVMEYMTNGSLYDYLRDADNFFPHQMVLTAALDIAVGMAHVHAAGVLQRDLKSKNCLLSDNLVCKVADFGLARFVKPNSTYTFVGTPFWAAPEIIRHEDYSEKADVYSFAIVLWELVERKDPYGTLNAFQVPLQVANDGLRPADFSRPAPLGLEPLMKQCWDADPEQRPPFAEIADTLHKWLFPPSDGNGGDASDEFGGDDAMGNKIAVVDLDLSTHIARGQHAATEEGLHRFAESHDASEKTIPIKLSSAQPPRGSATMVAMPGGSPAISWLKRKPSFNRSGSDRSVTSAGSNGNGNTNVNIHGTLLRRQGSHRSTSGQT